MRVRHHLLAALGPVAAGGRLETPAYRAAAELRRRGQLDLARAVVDSSSLRAMRGGNNWTEPCIHEAFLTLACSLVCWCYLKPVIQFRNVL